MKSMVFVGTLSLAASAFAFSRSFTIKSADVDLSQPSAYSAVTGGTLGTDVPSLKTDEIVIPNNMTFVLSDGTDDVSVHNFATANKVGRFRPAEASSKLCVIIEGDAPVTLACGFNGRGVKDTGTFVKDGPGELVLDPPNPTDCGATYNRCYQYYCGKTEIKDGTLAPTARADFYNLLVDASATLVLSDDPGHYSVVTFLLSGAGCITNRVAEKSTLHYLQVQTQTENVFTGMIVGRATVEARNGYLALSNPGNTFTALKVCGPKNTSTIALSSFGLYSTVPKSSVAGCTRSWTSYDQGGRYLYLGSGETANPDFAIYSYGAPLMIDAGPAGGLILTRQGNYGSFQAGQSSARPDGDVKHLVLQGDGLAESVVDASYLWKEDASKNGYALPFYLEKRGAGTWRLEKPTNAAYVRTGPTQVSGGTLRVGDWAEKGRVSALGRGTQLLGPAFSGNPATATQLDWSVMIGGETSDCTLEFTGSEDVANWSRPMTLTNNYARFRNAGTGLFDNAGLGTRHPSATTLYLDGTNGGENRFANITNTPGRGLLSVVKEGSNTYALTGETTFDGDLTVNGGKLVIDPPETENFRYFRLTVREIANNTASLAEKVKASDPENAPYAATSKSGESRWVHFDTWALYDANGVRQNVFTTSATDKNTNRFEKSVCLIEPGEIAYGRMDGRGMDEWSIGCSIRGLVSSDGGYGGYGAFVKYDEAVPVSRTNANSWVTYVCRLTNGTPEIVRYDLGSFNGPADKTFYRSPTSFFLEGSHDGLKWTLLHDVDEQEPPARMSWYSDPSESYQTTYSRAVKRPGKGFSFLTPAKTSAAPVPLQNVKRVQVAPGAELVARTKSPTLKTLVVDVAGGGFGKLDGFALATGGAGGTLELVNVPSRGNWRVSGSFTNMTDHANIGEWSVKSNGMILDDVIVRAAATGFTVIREKGLMLIVR